MATSWTTQNTVSTIPSFPEPPGALTFPKDTFLGPDVRLQLGCSDIDPHRLRQVPHSLGHNCLGRISRLKPGSFQPNIFTLSGKTTQLPLHHSKNVKSQLLAKQVFCNTVDSEAVSGRASVKLNRDCAAHEPRLFPAMPQGSAGKQSNSDLRAHLSSFHDEVSSHLEFASDLLQSGRCYPGWWMMRIGLSDGFQQQTSFFDITEGGGKNRKENFQHIGKQFSWTRMCSDPQ